MLNDLIRLIVAQLYQQPQLIEPRTKKSKQSNKKSKQSNKKSKTCMKKKTFYE